MKNSASEMRKVNKELFAWMSMTLSATLQALSVLNLVYNPDYLLSTLLLTIAATLAAFISTILRFLLVDGNKNRKRFYLNLTCFVLSATITLTFVFITFNL